MEELSKIYKEMGEKFINELFNDYVIVTEKLSGSSFSFQRTGNGLTFYKGSSDRPINLIDRTLMVYYEQPIKHIEKTTLPVLNSFPENWRFCFQYFVNNKPIVIEYDNLPVNGLVLTHIIVLLPNGKTEKIIDDPRVISDWSNILRVSPMIPIFKGYLSQKQKERIQNFISTPKEDHQEIFRTDSFAEFIIDILNPELDSTFLQKNLKKPIDSIIFKFYRNNLMQTYSAKMIDPYTMNLMSNREPIDLRKAPADINEILLLDLLSFVEERGLRTSQLSSLTPDERYIELISNVFNDYVLKKGNDIKNLEIQKADFAKGPEFDVNLDMIKNGTTKENLQKSEIYKNLFKIMLGSFRKLRDPKKVGNILTPSVIEDFNKMVKKIKEETDKEVDTSFKTFSDYVSTKNESLYEQNIEELIMEEKVLRFNEFINLGKINLDEKLLDVSIDKATVGMVDSNDTYSIDMIKRITASTQGKEEVESFLTTIGIPTKNQKDIINLISSGNWAKASSYLLNRSLSVDKVLGKKLNSYDINKELLGLDSKNISTEFFEYQWATQPPMGKGEVWLSIILQGGSKAGVGDVEVNGKIMEVKGMGARLVGQRGYGDAKKMPIHFKDAIINICNDLKITDYTPIDGDGLQWSVTKTTGRLLEENLFNVAKLKGGFNKKDIQIISKRLIEAYKNLYNGLNVSQYANIFENSINQNGSINLSEYNQQALILCFSYYYQVEQFTYFTMTNHVTGNFLIINPTDFTNLVKNGTILYSPQSWGKDAGTQGGYFAIAIDKISK
jgi:hypothetical protein